DDDISGHNRIRKMPLQCRVSVTGAVAFHAERVVRRDIGPVDKSFMQLSICPICHQNMSGVEGGIVLDDDVLRAYQQLKQPPFPSPTMSIDIVENIILE